MTHDKTIAEAAVRAMTSEALGVALELFGADGPGDSVWPEILAAELDRRQAEQNVTVALGGGTVIVGSIEVDYSGPDDADSPARAAAVAWQAITRNGVFTVNGRRYHARDCAEWWA